MAIKPAVQPTVVELCGIQGDDTIREYIAAVLELGDFDFGRHGENAFELFGQLLVDAGCLETKAQAREACRQLCQRLGNEEYVKKDAFRSLEGGPVLMDSMNRVTVHASEVISARDTIQTPYAEFNVGANLPKVSEADLAKLAKRAEKEEKARRAALAQHQAEAAARAAGANPVIVRNQGSLGAKDIHLENFSVSNGGKDLIEDASVTLAFGRRYGLVGRNGTGKTTLLRHLAAHLIKGIPENCQILHVEQEVTGAGTSVLETILRCDTERTELLQEEARIMVQLNSSEAPANGHAAAAGSEEEGAKRRSKSAVSASADPEAAAKLEKVYQRLQEIDADQAESRAASILAGLSFTPDMQAMSTNKLSGGWRMRVALARALFVEPDLLLLDEPTNHLDLHAVLWLEDYLLKWPKTLLVVSHARDFLNSVCTDILHLHHFKLTTYRGNYDVFEKTAAERHRNAKKAAEGQERQKKHMQAFVDKFRFNAKRASLVQSRIKAIERLGETEVIEDDPEYIFKFPAPQAVAGQMVSFQDVSFGYPGGHTLFRNLDFGLDMESRLAIVGANGIGKSTLLNLISGILEPTVGHITRNPKVRMATFSQHHVDGLDLALTPIQAMLKAFPNTKEQEMRSHLGSFGISGELALQTMYTLSGGQKSRVAFAKVTYESPHILLLDEPSNHLDLDAVTALIQGLNDFKGGVLMVSHDQFLIESTVNELWIVDNGAATPFHGSFQQYKNRLRAQQTK